MSPSWVPPDRTSPYQNGAGALANPALASSKLDARQAEDGKDASLFPRRNRQTALVEKISAPGRERVQSDETSKTRAKRIRIFSARTM